MNDMNPQQPLTVYFIQKNDENDEKQTNKE